MWRRLKSEAGLCTLLFASGLVACGEHQASNPPVSKASKSRSSILLITLDTTRADAIGPDAEGVDTPAFNAVASRGRRFRRAYATVPETLPSHSSMMTGLYPAAHGVHENARYLENHRVVAESLKEAGYRTAAFVSAFVLDRRFGLARGFDFYDDNLGEGRSERAARETTDRALAYLAQPSAQEPLFMWVHYFDPHYPYDPAEPFRSRYPESPYLGEIAAMDQELGRLVEAFQKRRTNPSVVILAGDHGEALGEHGESQHGNLLYEGVMRVPLVISGPGVAPGVIDTPISNRRIFHTILDWAGLGTENSLRADVQEIVLGEAMKPFLSFSWQPQIMAVEGRWKVIHAGKNEIYDVVADPTESRDLADEGNISRAVRQALREYPVPSPDSPPPSDHLSDEARRRLASLGYVASTMKPVVRNNAPRPRDMVHLFDELDQASLLFTEGQYSRAIPIMQKILAADPYNLMTALRVAAAHSALGNHDEALAAFGKAEAIAPESEDVRHYLALHFVRTGEWQRAVPLLERVLAESPDRLPALEAMAVIRERQERFDDALRLLQKIHAMKPPAPAEVAHRGVLAMNAGNTKVALQSFEEARRLHGERFSHHLELGVLYLEVRRLDDARKELDLVPASHPGYPMALFKRAQVSVLLGEPDRAARIAKSKKYADATTRELIARERLFQNVPR